MIDLHTHSLLSDGELLPSELVRRAQSKGYEAIAITDHADFSNIDFTVPRIVKACKELNKHWKIIALPGIEITHVPPKSIKALVKLARKLGAKVVIGHGETISEPVEVGTNKAFIEAGVDILAHPGLITEEDIKLAKKRNVCLEITSRKSHGKPNKRLIRLASKHKASMVLNTDTHRPDDLTDDKKSKAFLKSLGVRNKDIEVMIRNSRKIVKKYKD